MMIHEQEQTRIAWDNVAMGYSEFVTRSHMWLAAEGLRQAKLRPGMRFLDVAAGCGALSIPAAQFGAKVLAVDISPLMLEQLQTLARKENLTLETRVMDGHALELDNDTFDVVGSQFGVMLFPDMPRGIAEMVRVAKPGGRVLMNVFGNVRKVEFFRFFVEAVQAAVPSFSGPAMDPPPLPFQLQDPDRLRTEMSKAGLRDITIDMVTEELQFRSGKELWDWLLNSNPIVKNVLRELQIDEEQVVLIQQALENKISERAEPGKTAVLTAPINIGVGTK